ncbi:hypothetical protein EI555_012547 [Monodon monoceros]|uniref:C2H2-type domain-containing protein n=1 Tax=Monodon monoceros TaxID=40151 RepID=A0A4U1F928_MONMO|nr:hypothetical protein EI555_012547 [Monodon monoceros]
MSAVNVERPSSDNLLLLSIIGTLTGENPFACKDCGKAFCYRLNLSQHMKIHTGEKPYEYSERAKAFSPKLHLTEHRWIHIGERPYEFSKCGMSFTYCVLSNIVGSTLIIQEESVSLRHEIKPPAHLPHPPPPAMGLASRATHFILGSSRKDGLSSHLFPRREEACSRPQRHCQPTLHPSGSQHLRFCGFTWVPGGATDVHPTEGGSMGAGDTVQSPQHPELLVFIADCGR